MRFFLFRVYNKQYFLYKLAQQQLQTNFLLLSIIINIFMATFSFFHLDDCILLEVAFIATPTRNIKYKFVWVEKWTVPYSSKKNIQPFPFICKVELNKQWQILCVRVEIASHFFSSNYTFQKLKKNSYGSASVV